MKKLTIMGAGSWGLTLAWLYGNAMASRGVEVCLWSRSKDKIETLKQTPQITFPVSLTLPPTLQLTHNVAEAVENADIIYLVVSSSGTRSVLEQMKETRRVNPQSILINASKGLELPSLKSLSTVILEEFPDNPIGVLSGPTLAPEIVKGLPTAAVIAAYDIHLAEYLQAHLSTETLRLYSNTDLVGVEWGGTLKNIFAIVSGYMHAQSLGDNAISALITRGLAEMTRISLTMGAKQETLYGLSGLGDLLATCNSPYSRNFQVGFGLAQGKDLQTVLTELNMVAEGVRTTQAVSQLSDQLKLDTPIVKTVEMCFSSVISPEILIKSLMSRKLRSESF
ncbi:MAG: NAD(P)-dependent glycerol-3-phosphate dehydrogenase [Cyanobacteria bacterium]|nr:NAD(P)-dependent glycerol-3-phosphate dehydrogenase [Cyanobacteriota bacterium]